jgi:hypothetical protein
LIYAEIDLCHYIPQRAKNPYGFSGLFALRRSCLAGTHRNAQQKKSPKAPQKANISQNNLDFFMYGW